MRESQYTEVCDRTERKDERVKLRNIKSGQIGLTFGCTMEGETIQVELENGQLDSWEPAECEEL
jgi:formylmethanofuran dehydrogenase subunit C